MNTCACGSLTDNDGTMCARCAALHEIGLKSGANDDEIKAAYRLYVKAWHPDRFPGDERSKSAAQEKLKTVNSAFEFLTSPSSRRALPAEPNPAAPRAQPREPPEKKETASSSKQSSSGGWRSQEGHSRSSSSNQVPSRFNSSPPSFDYSTGRIDPTPSRALKKFLRIAFFVALICLGAYLEQELKRESPTIDGSSHARIDAETKRRIEAEAEKAWDRAVPNDNDITVGAKPDSINPTAPTPPHPIHKGPLSYFTVGSTKDEVLSVQGTPSSYSGSVFEYGFSRVVFQNGRVVNWVNSPLNPLKVTMR